MSSSIRALLAASMLIAAGAASADTITVNISSDPIDIDWQNATIEDLPGPDGKVSFSEAVIAANNTPGHDTIGFAIPRNEWTFQFLFPGRAVVVTSYSYFWRASEELTIDGTTQTAFTGDTNPNGAEVVLYGGEMYLNADHCTLIGLDSSVVSFTGSAGIAQGNTGTTNLTVYGGSGSLIRGNQGSTLKIDRSNDNIVIGNRFQRIRVLGWVGGGQPATNNRIGGPYPEDRNFITGFGTVNSEGLPSGFSIQLFDATGTIIENNSIGSTPDGMQSGHAFATMGIRFEGENRDTVVRNNRIAGVLGIGQGPHHAGQLFGWAIWISGGGSGIRMVGNTIGLNANGEPFLGSVTGIDVGTWAYAGAADIQIGGTAPGEGNVIAGHLQNGIVVGRDVPQARISGNSIHSNAALGIDLIPSGYGNGVTPNDPLDADGGANGLQNFPEIALAERQGNRLRVAGSLRSSPSRLFTLEFFASPACDGSGNGEGQVFLGSTSVNTDGAGNAAFDLQLDSSPAEGWVVTATATLESIGATSEFSACLPVAGGSASLDDLSLGVGDGSRILQTAPNPFRSGSSIRYELRSDASVRLLVFDASGRSIRTIVEAPQSAGVHSAFWDGRDNSGADASPGVYFYELRAGAERLTKQVVLAR